jgi:hypothetical protein
MFEKNNNNDNDNNKNNSSDDGNNNNSNSILKKKKGKTKVQEKTLVERVNTLDEGVIAFAEWLASIEEEDSETLCGPLSLVKYEQNCYSLIFDRLLGKQVKVSMVDGVPQCMTCNDIECIHVGFSICTSQKYQRNGMVNLT